MIKYGISRSGIKYRNIDYAYVFVSNSKKDQQNLSMNSHNFRKKNCNKTNSTGVARAGSRTFGRGRLAVVTRLVVAVTNTNKTLRITLKNAF